MVTPPSFEVQRQAMVRQQLMGRGIRDAKVLAAFAKVPRHLFVPPEHRAKSYLDHPLPIGNGQTISQPYIAALMTEALELPPHGRVLDIGTGSGYQTAILAEMSASVYTIERIPQLLESASNLLRELGVQNVQFRAGDGTLGWPEAAPFDGILITAAAPKIPQTLLAQLADGGRLVIPIGSAFTQNLTVVEKTDGKLHERILCGCVFVPLIGAEGWKEAEVSPEEIDQGDNFL